MTEPATRDARGRDRDREHRSSGSSSGADFDAGGSRRVGRGRRRRHRPHRWRKRVRAALDPAAALDETRRRTATWRSSRRPSARDAPTSSISPVAASPRSSRSLSHERSRSIERSRRCFLRSRIGCGLMRRAYDSTAIVRRVLTGGWLGPLTRIVVREGGRFTGSGTDRSYFDDERAGGGILLELGCHALDLAIHLTGATRHTVVRQRLLFDGGARSRRRGRGSAPRRSEGTRRRSRSSFDSAGSTTSTTRSSFTSPPRGSSSASRPGSAVRLAGAGADPGVALAPCGRGDDHEPGVLPRVAGVSRRRAGGAAFGLLGGIDASGHRAHRGHLRAGPGSMTPDRRHRRERSGRGGGLPAARRAAGRGRRSHLPQSHRLRVPALERPPLPPRPRRRRRRGARAACRIAMSS